MNFDRLTGFLDWVVAEKGVPGVDLALSSHGNVIYRYMTGYRDRERNLPVTNNTSYYLFSCSKVITCIAALQLFEQGKFLMTDWVSDYLPEFASMTVQTAQGIRDAQNHITMKDLFTMTAGLSYDLVSPSIRETYEKTNGFATTREIVSAIAKEPLLFEPGTYWSYGLEHDVLGAVIESISGESLGEYMENHIFRPLGMDHTGFRAKAPETMAVLYKRDEATGEVAPFLPGNEYILSQNYESGGAGLISTTDDYLKFSQMLARGGTTEDGTRLIAQNTLHLMRTNHLDSAQQKGFNWGHFGGYGYGLGVRTLVDRSITGALSPIGEFGWQGAAGSYMFIDMENELTVQYSQHMLNSLEPFIHPRLRNIIYTALEY